MEDQTALSDPHIPAMTSTFLQDRFLRWVTEHPEYAMQDPRAVSPPPPPPKKVPKWNPSTVPDPPPPWGDSMLAQVCCMACCMVC